MKLYDSTISKSLELAGSELKSLPVSSSWKNLDEKVFLFPDDGAVELGATGQNSSYLIAYTTDKKLVQKDEILLRVLGFPKIAFHQRSVFQRHFKLFHTILPPSLFYKTIP